jgi:uncharacterized metal-binding protein YceD (DUF177 family)
MKVHLKQIPPEGLHLEGEEDCPLSELEPEQIRCAGALRYKLDLGVSDGALWANGSLAQCVEISCVACLEKFVYEIKVPAFAIHMELHGPEMIDLTPLVREELLLNMPAYPHCDRDGGRKCKAAKIGETDLAQEQRAAKREHDWGELDRLKL